MYNRSLLLVLVLGIASYTVAAPALLMALLAIPAAYIGWRLSMRSAGGSPIKASARLPASAVNLLLIAAVAFAVYRASTQGFEVSHVAELVVFILLIKLGDRRGPRDDAQILYLSVFLAIAAMLTSNNLWVGAVLAIFLPALVGAVMLYQLHKGRIIAGLAPKFPVAGTPPTPERRPPPGSGASDSFRRNFRRTTAFAAIGTVAAALVVFIIMPRGIGENTLGSWGNPQRGAVTGFADRVSMGSRGVISTSPTVVLDLMVREYSEDGGSLTLGSSESVHYLRGAVLDSYEDGVWQTARGEPKRVQSGVDLPPGEERVIAQPYGPTVEQVITLRTTADSGGARRRGGPSTRLFSMWRPVRVQVQRHSRLTIHHSDGIIERFGEPGPLTYTVWSAIQDVRGGPTQRELYGDVEEEGRGDERRRTPVHFESEPIRELASQILRSASIDPDPKVRPISDDSRAARTIQDYLRSNFEYTLDEQYFPPDVHPIEYFLFELRRGHCEYYASAMAAMCRSVGINARVITGYVAAEFNQASGHYTVRESNAHAWVEAEAGQNRWRRFDPTPTSDLVRIHRPQRTVLSRVRQMLDAVEFAWNTSIVGFDAGRREQILRTNRVRESSFIQRLDAVTANTPLAKRETTLGWLANLALVFLLLSMPAAGGFMVWQWLSRRKGGYRRRVKQRGGQDRMLDPVFFQRYLEAIARRGHPKPSWSPPLAHAQAIPAPEIAGDASDITRLYYQARFGGRPLEDADLARVERMIDRLMTPPDANGTASGPARHNGG